LVGVVDGNDVTGFHPGTGWERQASLLIEQSKLDPPSPRPGTVHRTAVLEHLHAAAGARVVSVAAPAGYGKSALLGQWAEESPHQVAWLSLEREDNDPAVFLAYVAAALARLGPVDTDAFRARLPPGTSVASIVARRVTAALGSVPEPLTLVLDHAEVLDNNQCRDAIGELAVRLPPAAHLIVASRGSPPVPLSALRSRGALVEVGTDDLAMNVDEARALMEGAGVDLADDDLEELVRRTEGWPAGLYLAALALEAGGLPTTPRGPFTGDHRLMADYLRAELLARIPRGRLSFLTRTSVLDRMCGPLCDAVLDRSRSARLLEELESANLLLVPLDRRREWYRYHTLFGELLRAELERREHGTIAGLHARAAAWCEANGQPAMAIDHAQAAGDADVVARLVAEHLLEAYAAGRVETVCRWLQWFDDRSIIEDYPAVAVFGAALLSIIGQAGAAERWAAAAERAPGDGTVADGSTVASWRALLHAWTCRHGVARMRHDAEEAIAGLSPASRWRPTAVALEGLACLLEGDADRANAAFARAVDLGIDITALPITSASLAERAAIAMARGDWHDADLFAQRAHKIMREGQLDDYSIGALVHAVAARVAARHGDVARARAHLTQAARVRPQLTYVMPTLSVQALLELGRAYLALGDPAGARVVLREARDILRLRPDLGTLPQEADDLRAAVDALQGGAVGTSSLTAAELRLVPLLATHLTFPEIGERLYISRNTVKTQATSIYRKLGVASRSEAVDRMRAAGLLGADAAAPG
jgi:LuxR family maltose regulon positive regulatory protein